jgi:PRTRC genetic system protein A
MRSQTNKPNLELVSHKVIKEPTLPEHTSHLYEYLFAANGVFVRAKRPNLEVLVPVTVYERYIRGLATVTPYVKLTSDKIPINILLKMLEESRNVGSNEILFHLNYNNQWQLETPLQIQTPSSCKPLNDDRNSTFANALIDAHSHAFMPAFFSPTDDKDETGFRIYTVLGRVNTNAPEICTRIGLYQHYWDIPSHLIYELPGSIIDRHRAGNRLT